MASLLTHLTRHRRLFSTSSILSPDSKTPLSAISKTRAALSLLKSEQNPERIIEICRAASLTPDLHIDRVVFSLAVSTLSRSNHFSYIQQFLDEQRITRTDLDPERFTAHSIVLFGQANMFDHAIRTFKQFHETHRNNGSGTDGQKRIGSVKCLNSLLFAAVLSKNYSEANRVFISFTNAYHIVPVLDTYNLVIKAFCESKSSSSAYSILAEMDKKGVKPNAATFGELIAGLYSEEKYSEVEKVLTMMKEKYGVNPGVSTYNIRILSFCKLRKSREAKALLEEMLKKGIKPNSVTYSHLIHGFCKEGDLEEAKRLFTNIARTDAECHYTMVYYLCQGKDFISALSICKESIRKGWVPNFTSMKMLVNGLASIGKVEEAKELIGLMKEKFTKNIKLWEEVEAALPQ